MNCPFYAQALHNVGRHTGLATNGWVLVENPQSNQCALITGAHSPCMLEVVGIEPRWELCVRNPENNGTAPTT